MTLDYPEDLEFFSCRARPSSGRRRRDPRRSSGSSPLLRARPDIVAINSGVQERYWQRFNALYQPVQLKRGMTQARRDEGEPRWTLGGRLIGPRRAGVHRRRGGRQPRRRSRDRAGARRRGRRGRRRRGQVPDLRSRSARHRGLGAGVLSAARRPCGKARRRCCRGFASARTSTRRSSSTAAGAGIVFLSTPFDHGSAALLARLGVPAFKVGSGELTNLPFLTELAGTRCRCCCPRGCPTSTRSGRRCEAIRGRGVPLVLLHCVVELPGARTTEANLRAMDAMRTAFGVPVGYSDHCMGFEVSLAAVARDACILERHLTLDRSGPGPITRCRWSPAELRELVDARAGARALAWETAASARSPPSEELRIVARRSIVAARALAAGEDAHRRLRWRSSAPGAACRRPGLGSLVGARLTGRWPPTSS